MSELLDNRPWGVWQSVGIFFAGLGASVLAGIAVGPELTDTEIHRVLIPVQTLVQIAIIAWMASRSARRLVSLGLRVEASDFIGIPLGVAFQIAAAIVLWPIVEWVFDGEAPQQDVVESAAGLAGLDIVLVVVGAGILAPLAEELLFRGVFLRALIVRKGSTFATYVTAGVFAAIHLLDPAAWLFVPILFALGVVLAKMTIKTGRLAMATLTHAAFNLLAVASLFLVE